MRELSLNEPLQLDTGTYDVIERTGNWVRLRPHHPGATIELPTAELARRIIGLPTLDSVPVRSLETIGRNGRQTALKWEQHLVQLETGYGPDGSIRPEYDIRTTTQEQRITTKISELKIHHGETISRATLMRKLKAYRTHGAAGLIDGRAAQTHGPIDRLDDRIHETLAHVLAEQKLRSTRTASRLIIETQARLIRQYGANAPKLPSKASMYRYIDAMDAGRHSTGRATTRRSLGNRPQRTFAQASQLLPGAEVQIDSTSLDLLIRTEKGEERPTLTIMLDVATRSILAWTLRLGATKGVDHAVLLAQALTPPQNRPARDHQRAAVSARAPKAGLLSATEHEAARQSAPQVFPKSVTIDNGRDYDSATFRSALQRFGIDLTLSAPHTPTDKPHVERTFGSINSLFTQHLPGYTGKSVVDRGHDPRKEALLDFWTLYELFDDFVLHTWQNRPHAGLTNRVDPTICYSPNQMLTAASALTATLQVPLTEADYISLLPVEHRAIGSTGVQIGNRHYDNELLHPLRRTKSSNPAKNGKWTVHVDPYNWQTVWVVGPEKELIACTTRDTHLDLHPFAAELGDVKPFIETPAARVAREGAEFGGVPIHQPPRAAPAPVDVLPPVDLSDIAGFEPFDPTKD